MDLGTGGTGMFLSFEFIERDALITWTRNEICIYKLEFTTPLHLLENYSLERNLLFP